MPKPANLRTITQRKDDIDAIINAIGQHQGGYVSFGRFQSYIDSITLPESIRAGDEYVSITEPVLVLKRKVSVLRELFQKPYFHIARKIRIKFHWDGIHILGANMEEPNCFLMPIPFHNNEPHNWFLKLSCLKDCAPGKKSLYVSVEILRENLITSFVVFLAKTFAILSLLITLIFPILYFLSDTVRIYINNEIGVSGSGTISLAAVLIFSILIISKQFDEVFPRLVPDQNTPPLALTDSHSKDIVLFTLNVIKPRR